MQPFSSEVVLRRSLKPGFLINLWTVSNVRAFRDDPNDYMETKLNKRRMMLLNHAIESASGNMVSKDGFLCDPRIFY